MHALIVEVQDGQLADEPLFDRISDEIAPLGSIFKLYVLYAVAKAIADGELSWDTTLTISEHNRSLPSGELQAEPDGTEVSVRQAATMMIEISDNTATDMLIHELGRPAVESAVREAGHHDPDMLTPFPTTREIFQIGWGDPAHLDTWSTGSTQEQRALLDELAHQPIEPHDLAVGGDPVWPLGVEWFGTAYDVAEAHVALHNLSDPTVRTILSKNPGMSPQDWDYVGFKGGSSPGVVAGSWLLGDPQARYVVVFQAATQDAAGVTAASEARLFRLAAAGAQLASTQE